MPDSVGCGNVLEGEKPEGKKTMSQMGLKKTRPASPRDDDCLCSRQLRGTGPPSKRSDGQCLETHQETYGFLSYPPPESGSQNLKRTQGQSEEEGILPERYTLWIFLDVVKTVRCTIS
jgi:hypothetical protein